MGVSGLGNLPPLAMVEYGSANGDAEEGWHTMRDGATSETEQLERQHIFAVNGSPEILDLVRKLLQDENYNVTTTNFVPGTFDQIEALNPDLLIIDLVVGVRAGWELLDRLQADAGTRGMPMIVFSTDPDLLEQAQALDTPGGRRRFLAKPFSLAALLALVDELIGTA